MGVGAPWSYPDHPPPGRPPPPPPPRLYIKRERIILHSCYPYELNLYLCACYLCRCVQGAGSRHIKKSVYLRFGFDSIRISQIQRVSQKQSNGECSQGVYIPPSASLAEKRRRGTIIHRRGAFVVARFD